jgi:putative tryptophan/tyrosine transport system substrate-binding protein
MKKILLTMVILAAIATISVPVLSAATQTPEKRIGILVWNEELRYRQSVIAIRDRLREDGLADAQVDFKEEVAMGNKATAMKMAKDLAAARMDLYFVTGTSAALALSKEVREAPIVFTMVYDPVSSGLVKSMQSSQNNVTGTSTHVAMDGVIAAAQRVMPIKTLAILYTPGEKNSELQVKDVQAVEKKCGIQVVPVPLLNAEEVPLVVGSLKGRADAIFLTGSAVVDKTIPQILEVSAKCGILTLTHLVDSVNRGVILGAGPNARETGLVAGSMGTSILRGTRPSDIPITIPQKLDIYVNLKAARAAGITIPESLLKEATLVIE